MTTSKSKVRESARSARNALSQEERREKSNVIMGFLHPLLEPHTTVMVYVSKDPEVDTLPLLRHLLGEKKRVVVPIIQREDRSLRLSYLTSLSTLRPSTFNVPEPIGNEIPAEAERIEVAVIPLVGFDRKGNRIGYGAGYYDRFLQKNRQMMKIGVAFACQEVPIVPAEPFDIRMDVIITEEGVHRCENI